MSLMRCAQLLLANLFLGVRLIHLLMADFSRLRSLRIVKKNICLRRNNYGPRKIPTRAISYLGGNVERLEARRLGRRLFPSTPEDPCGPEGCCSESTIRTARRGARFQSLADMVGNGAPDAAIMKEMYQKRRRVRKSAYLRRFEEYFIARDQYVQTYRRVRESRPLVGPQMRAFRGGEFARSADFIWNLPPLVHTPPQSMRFPTCDYQHPLCVRISHTTTTNVEYECLFGGCA